MIDLKTLLEPMALVGLLEPAGRWLMTASWKASVVVLLVLAVQAVLRDRLPPRWSHALWCLVLVRLLMPALPESSVSLFNLARLAPGLHGTGSAQLEPGGAPAATGVKLPVGGWLELTLNEPRPVLAGPSGPVVPVLMALWLGACYA